MPYREKIAWLYLAAMALTYGPYFLITALHPPGDALPNLHQFWRFAVTAGAHAILAGGGQAAIFLQNREEARQPLDERDLAILHRSRTYAYYTLLSGTILVGCFLPIQHRGWTLVNGTLLAIVVAESVQNGFAAASYRRQAGGEA